MYKRQVGSSIAREADNVFYTLAGPEIAVATTKAYSTQLIAGYCLAVQFALVRGCISQGRYQDLISQLQCLPEQIQKILDDKERIQWFAAKPVSYTHLDVYKRQGQRCPGTLVPGASGNYPG